MARFSVSLDDQERQQKSNLRITWIGADDNRDCKTYRSDPSRADVADTISKPLPIG